MRILDVEPARAAQAQAITGHLVEGEAVIAAYVSPTGAVLFTDRRILLVQREHLLEARVETSSYPYRKARHLSTREGEAGRSQVRIWRGAEDHPLHLRAGPGNDLGAVQRLLAERLG